MVRILIMTAYDKVLIAIQNKPQNGHAIANQQNKINLKIANLEIENMISSICGK